ncbi:hypothetical protein MC378_01695 [Polaribacter sp. MSW13]|uniref:Uncharacterized protein n=1 Tax=Polaribacter marinus TaxID=2916838 RepID=A0A9X2AHS0_9FLAO|nr:hypothetical protein [Polaribacter marinus]MCI2227861.1 hypothetical protein [Polaribacter marinus]
MEKNLKNSIQFLNQKTGKTTGFSTPSNYFEEVENQFTTLLFEEKHAKKTVFKTPDNYFDTIDNEILAKVSSTKKEVKVISLKDRLLKFIPVAAAASVVLFIGLNSLVFNKTELSLFDQLDDNDVEQWVSNNINLINDNDIALTYTDIEFEDSEVIPNSISNDELENYLSNHEDISLILEND